MMLTKDEIVRWMREKAREHAHPLTGEVNITALAEDAYDALDPDAAMVEPSEEYFEYSHEVVYGPVG